MIKCFPREVEAQFSIRDAFSDQHPRRLKQTHSAQGFRIGSESGQEVLEGDYIWTTSRGVPTAVVVADCTAALIFGQQADGPFVGALHAGWRGTALGIMEDFWKRVAPLGRLQIWLSPSICQEHFEVGSEVLEALGKGSVDFARPSQNPNKWLMDLKGFQIAKWHSLAASTSVTLEIFSSSLCTYCQPDFISYRRARGALSSNDRHFASITLR